MIEEDVPAVEFPTLFTATALNVYTTPSVKPVQVYVVPLPVHVAPAGEEVTV